MKGQQEQGEKIGSCGEDPVKEAVALTGGREQDRFNDELRRCLQEEMLTGI